MPVLNQSTSGSGTLSIKPLSAQITQLPLNSSLNFYLVFDSGSKKIQTSSSFINNEGNPSWNEELQLNASGQQTIMIEVWDKNNSNDVLGVSQLKVPKIIAMGGSDQDFFPIFYQQKLVGTLQLACNYKGNVPLTSSNIKENYPPINTSQTSSKFPGYQYSQATTNISSSTPSQIKQQLYTQEPLKTSPSPMSTQMNYAPPMQVNQPTTQQQVPMTQPMMMQPQYQQYVPNTVIYNVQPQPQQVVYTQQTMGFGNPCYDPCYNQYVGPPIFGSFGHHYGDFGHHGHHGHHC